MAGIQSCCKKLLLVGSSRVVSRNGILHQPSRGRHNLVFQICFQPKNLVFSKTRLNFGSKHLYRLASTNVTETKEALKTPEVTASTTTNPTTSSSQTAPIESPSSNVVIDESSLPPVPSLDSDVPPLEFVTTGLMEPSIKSLGLGSWWPSGMVQQALEFIHVTFDWPWWAAIAAVTVVLRLATFPITLSSKRDNTNMLNNMPQITQFQRKITEAKRNGDYFLAAAQMQELQEFVVEKKINMMAFIRPMLFQTPFFLSMFWGLRGMAEAPVESFKTEGLLWFTDLTVSDPYYILPCVLGVTMHAMIRLGAEGVSLQSVNNYMMQAVLKGIPVVVFAVSTQFQACVLWYWTISNLIVLMQTTLLKVPAASDFFRIPKLIKHDPSVLKPDPKGFIEGFKEGYSNAKITKEVEERERLNTLTFERAGTCAIPRTFKHNPNLFILSYVTGAVLLLQMYYKNVKTNADDNESCGFLEEGPRCCPNGMNLIPATYSSGSGSSLSVI